MPATALATPRRGRLATWFGGTPDVQDAAAAKQPHPVATDSRTIVARQLFTEIGEFLARHQLAPMPIHFEIAHAYITGEDPAIAAAVGAMLADKGSLDPERIGALIARMRPVEDAPQALAALALKLETRLAECLSAADRSHSSARDYGDALDDAQSRFATDPTGTLEHIVGLTREVVETTRLVETELKQTRRETEVLRGDLDRARAAAERDHLTGLPNRRGFERRLDEMLSIGDERRRMVVAVCDIDDFKRVNDVHGHPAGDRVLRFVANFLASELGETVCVARYGGEEFAVVIDGRSVHEAVMMLDDVRERLGARSLVNSDTGEAIGRITFSAGVAALTDTVNRALEAADAALYRAKRDGKNAVHIGTAC